MLAEQPQRLLLLAGPGIVPVMGTGQGCGTLGMLRMDVCPRGWLRPAALLLTGKPPSVPHFPHGLSTGLPPSSRWCQLSSARPTAGMELQLSARRCAPGSRSQSQPHGPINVNGNGNRRRLLPAPCQHSSSHTPPRSAVPPPGPWLHWGTLVGTALLAVTFPCSSKASRAGR